jgi:phosphoenolpyruvate phosphomutase
MGKFLEAHSELSAILIDKSDFDGIWISSLTHSALLGYPDNELITLRERADLANRISRITNKPIIVDIDTGGTHLAQVIRQFRNVYAVVMEDKRGSKQNSLLENGKHELEDIDAFCEKIKVIKANGVRAIARLESLIVKHSIYEALVRAEAYVKAGADGILIHSKQKVEATEVMEFATKFRHDFPNVMLAAIPTNYILPENNPFEIVIYANQMLRASLKGMKNYLDGKEDLSSVEDIFNLVGH